MNDPWDVQCVRQGRQYQSLMKINGIPLLPPVRVVLCFAENKLLAIMCKLICVVQDLIDQVVYNALTRLINIPLTVQIQLSKECRKEMQYYKLLAKEVEKRIMILRPYVDSETESIEEKNHARELPGSEVDKFISPVHKNPNLDIAINNTTPALNKKENAEPPNLIIQLEIPDDTDIEQDMFEDVKLSRQPKELPIEVPERDCDYSSECKKEVITEVDSVDVRKEKTDSELIDDIINFDFNTSIDSELYIPLRDGPSSLSSKSFTGSLHDLHTESAKESQPSLIRQRSYTVLKPSPQLLAHLEIQSICTGVEVTSISMTDSSSNLNKRSKKRRSWDLESAKIKWSSMALELKKSHVSRKTSPTHNTPNNNVSSNGSNNVNNKNVKKTSQVSSPLRPQSLNEDKIKKPISNTKTPKSESHQRTKSPVRFTSQEKDNTVEKHAMKETSSPIIKIVTKTSPHKSAGVKKQDHSAISNANETAARVKELYEKLQKQQVTQMTSLMEKQKREKELLQKVFEEQNTILLKQLKTVCPKAQIEIKQAWGDLKDDENRGPVSLSQLISNKPELSLSDSPVSKTLTETNLYINKCEKVLKTSRDLTNSLKKPPQKSRTPNNRNLKAETVQVIKSQPEGNRTRSYSPNVRNASRKLNYDTASSEASTGIFDYDALLTDRTNDTLADLNITFPSDTDDGRYTRKSDTVDRNRMKRQTATRACSPPSRTHCSTNPCTDVAIRNLEDSIQNSMKSITNQLIAKPGLYLQNATAEKKVAATKIVAYAKGYLVRRLMLTERVQGIVQTIRDALLCALQLHQDREGIRGADVDLHRRLIQQITAACYTLHDTFISSTPAERCAMIAADRNRKQALAVRTPTPRTQKRTDVMSQSHSGAFPARAHRPNSATIMTLSNYETFSGDKARSRYMPSPRHRPWR